MFRSLKLIATSLASIASTLNRIDASLHDAVELYYRDAGLTRTPTVVPEDKDATRQPLYASDATTYYDEQREQGDQGQQDLSDVH